MHLVVALTKAKMLERADGRADYNISEIVKSIPTAKVLDGDPNLVVEVEVDPCYAKDLRQKVAGICNVDEYEEYSLLKRPRHRSASRFSPS